MDIAKMSTSLSSAKVMQAASLAMAKKVMNIQKQQGADLVQAMQKAAPPPSDLIIDVRA